MGFLVSGTIWVEMADTIRPAPRPRSLPPAPEWLYEQDTDPAKMMPWQIVHTPTPTRLPCQVRTGPDQTNIIPLTLDQVARPWDSGAPQLPTRLRRPVATGLTSIELGLWAQQQPWDVPGQTPTPGRVGRRLDHSTRPDGWPVADAVQQLAGWQSPAALPLPRRRQPPQPGPAGDPPAPAWLLDVILYRAATDTDPQQPTRLRRLQPQEVIDLAAIASAGQLIALDQLGRAWHVEPQRPTRLPAQVRPGHDALTLDVSQRGPSVPIPSQPAALPVRIRHAGPGPAQAEPSWLAAGLVIVSGPYYAVAGQLYVAGAVAGDARSVS